MGKVGKGERGRDEGYGKWVELADLPTLHMLSHRYVTTSLKADDSKFSEQLDDNSHVVDKDDFGNISNA